MPDQAQLHALIQTPRIQWYMRHGAQARNVARVCQDAESYLDGAMTYRQGSSGSGINDPGTLNYTVRKFFDDDELTPALREFLAAAGAQEGAAIRSQVGEPAEQGEFPADIPNRKKLTAILGVSGSSITIFGWVMLMLIGMLNK